MKTKVKAPPKSKAPPKAKVPRKASTKATDDKSKVKPEVKKTKGKQVPEFDDLNDSDLEKDEEDPILQSSENDDKPIDGSDFSSEDEGSASEGETYVSLQENGVGADLGRSGTSQRLIQRSSDERGRERDV